MTDRQRIENAATAKEATEAAGHPHARGSRAGDIEGGLMRYLAAEAYHEKVQEENEKAAPEAPKGRASQ
ncbi:MAG TPA: hypothetical protein VHO29_06380 [Marmoricola sp.]|nr:hypothetical protein [Marmoricola sp.]